jgi:hypothetical protein
MNTSTDITSSTSTACRLRRTMKTGMMATIVPAAGG